MAPPTRRNFCIMWCKELEQNEQGFHFILIDFFFFFEISQAKVSRENAECRFVPLETVSHDEWHCSVTRPAPLFYWLEVRVLVARRGFVEVRLAALTPSWHFGESDSPASLCKRRGGGGGG